MAYLSHLGVIKEVISGAVTWDFGVIPGIMWDYRSLMTSEQGGSTPPQSQTEEFSRKLIEALNEQTRILRRLSGLNVGMCARDPYVSPSDQS